MNPIIDKIQKLLRLAKCSAATPAEAAAALEKAIQLAMQHGIDIAKLITRAIAPKSTPPKSLTAGFLAGQKTPIHNAIRGTEQPLLF